MKFNIKNDIDANKNETITHFQIEFRSNEILDKIN